MPAVESVPRALTTSLPSKPSCLPRGVAQREAPALRLQVTSQIFSASQTFDTLTRNPRFIPTQPQIGEAFD